MEFRLTETNKGKKSLVYEGYTFRVDRALASGDLSWRCTSEQCTARLKTDPEISTIHHGNSEYSHEENKRKLERQVMRAAVKRKAFSDISTRPMKLM